MLSPRTRQPHHSGESLLKVSAVRFFWVVSPHPPYVLVGFAALVAVGAWLLRLNPADVESPLAAVLYFQMFAASSGFKGPAGRGHYDELFVSGQSRPSIGFSHWLASALPGIVAWTTIGVLGIVLAPHFRTISFRPQGLVGLLLVSTFSWALTLALPRLSGGVLWTIVLVVIAVTRDSLPTYLRAVTAATSIRTMSEAVRLGVAFAVCPFLLLTRSPVAAYPPVLLLDAVLALITLIGGVLYITRRDYPLLPEV